MGIVLAFVGFLTAIDSLGDIDAGKAVGPYQFALGVTLLVLGVVVYLVKGDD